MPLFSLCFPFFGMGAKKAAFFSVVAAEMKKMRNMATSKFSRVCRMFKKYYLCPRKTVP